MPDGYRLLDAGYYRLSDGAGPWAWDGSVFTLMGSGRGTVAVGGEALLPGETNGFATDFTYETDASRVAVKTAGVVASQGLNTFYQNGGTSPKVVYDVVGNLVWAPHNMCLQSQTLDQATPWGLTGLTITADAIAAPDGTLTADRLVETATSNNHQLTGANISQTIGATYTISFYAKAGERNWLSALQTNGTPANFFDLTNGVLGTTAGGATITSVGSGWYFCTVTYVNAGAGGPTFHIRTSNGQVAIYLGDVTKGLYIWGVQLNRGALPTSYLPTTTVARYGVAVDYDRVTHAAKYMVEEQAATNLCLQASDFTNASWTKSNLTAAFTATDPFGIASRASTLTATAANATALQAIVSSSQARVTSVFLKRRTGSGNVDLTQDNGSTWTTQTITSSWVRYALATVTSANPTVGIRLVTSGDEVDVAIFQHENGTFSTSPIPTFTAGVTRAADNYTFLLSTIPSLGSEYSIYVRFSTPNIASGKHVVVVTDGTLNEFAGFATNTTARLAVVDNTVAVGAITGSAITANTPISVAGRFKLNDCAMSVSGAAVGTDVTVTMPTVTEVRFGGTGNNVASTGTFYIEKLVIVTPSWNDATLQTKATT